MKNKILALVIAFFGMATVNVAHATLVIDDFSNNTSTILSTISLKHETIIGLTGSDFSDSRLLTISTTSTARGRASTRVKDGKLVISTGTNISSDTTSSYSNIAGFDFTVLESGKTLYQNAFVFSLLSIDQLDDPTTGVGITLKVDDISSYKFVNSISDVVFEHTLFGNLTDVNNIELLIHNFEAIDASFDSLVSYGGVLETPSVNAVPLPGSLMLLSSAIAVLGFSRRKAS